MKSFEDGDGDGDTPGGAPAVGGNGGTAATGDGGEEPGSGGSSTGGLGGVITGGAPTGGTPSGGRMPIGGGPGSGGAAGRGGAPGGRGGAPGGRGGFGGDGLVGGGGFGKGGLGGKGGGAAGAGTGGTAGTCSGACLVHRYAFSGTDAIATDSVGSVHGTIVGGIQSSGVVTLAGGASDQYVSFPASILTGLADVTLEFWVTWTGGTVNWHRVFDFGSNDGASGDQGSTNTDSSYFFFTPRALATSASANCTTTTTGMPRVTYTIAGAASETCVIGSAAFPTSMTQVAVTTEGTTLSLYIGGASAGTSVTLPGGIASVTRTNNWLGRSQYTQDAEFSGTISEFRVYSAARSASQIAASNAAGPDTPPTQ